MNNLEKNYHIRSFNAEFVANDDSRTIRGLAIPINSRSEFLHEDDGDYFEIILPEAVNETLIEKNDVKIYLDHDPTQGTFARSKYGTGSLRLEITDRGLEFEFEAPSTVFGNALLEGIKRGDYDAVSFGFIPENEFWADDLNGDPVHYIRSFAYLIEISILSLQPAFSATEVDVRSLNDFKERKSLILNNLDVKMNEINEIVKDLNI